MENNETQTLNLSGTVLEISMNTWILVKKRMPSESQNALNVRGNDIFVERNAVAFRAILDYHLFGILHMPTEMCPLSFKLELDFWGIEPVAMEKCCFQKYVSFFENTEMLRILEVDENKRHAETSKLVSMTRCGGWKAAQARVWLVLNEPFSSTAAKV